MFRFSKSACIRPDLLICLLSVPWPNFARRPLLRNPARPCERRGEM